MTEVKQLTIDDLIELLEKIRHDNPGIKVVRRTTIGTLSAVLHGIGTVRAIPVEPGSEWDKRPHSRGLNPGYEWRVPINREDQPDVEREMFVII